MSVSQGGCKVFPYFVLGINCKETTLFNKNKIKMMTDYLLNKYYDKAPLYFSKEQNQFFIYI